MSLVTVTAEPNSEVVVPRPDSALVSASLARLREWFGVEFSIWDGPAGRLLHRSSEQPAGDESLRSELVRSLAGSDRAEFIDDADSVVLLALPLPDEDRRHWVAVAAFVVAHVGANHSVAEAARLLGVEPDEAVRWINAQPLWTAHAVERLASTVLATLRSESERQHLQSEVEQIADHLSMTYEEISLLHGLTQNLRISRGDEELGQMALEWLRGCLPADSVAIQFLPITDDEKASYDARTQPVLLKSADCPLDNDGMARLVEALELVEQAGPSVANKNITSQPTWQFADVRQVVIAPMSEGDHIFGWLAAFNHTEDGEFGTVEASLLASVGVLLGIHSGNRELYRQQREFLADVVRALTSAIDAKDPYTCGHSDRVARVAVRLAQELQCDTESINTLYMAGLLHDIGKIGIDDSVLRKPGRLTPAEYEHIKLHPELGHKILADLKQLADVLPVVLYHHEQWDGGGYPHGLQGDETPLLARIAAVADAYDAMTSDRPYRQGMPEEKVAEIFRSGAGQQWDARVIDAFFSARDDIQEISRRERENLSLDVQLWR